MVWRQHLLVSLNLEKMDHLLLKLKTAVDLKEEKRLDLQKWWRQKK